MLAVRRVLIRLGRAAAMCWHYALQRQKVEMAYRSDFLVNVGINLLYSVIQIFFIWALFYRVPTIAGWTFEQVVLIYGFGQLSFGYFSVGFFSMVVGFADHYVIEGNLDRPLLRPLSPLFQLVMENISLRDVTIVLKGTAIVWWALGSLDPPVRMTAGIFLVAQALGIIGAMVYAGVFLAVTSISFWVKDRVGFASPLFAVSEAARYPITIYHPAVQLFFSLLVPFGFCAFYPAVYFVDPQSWRLWLLAGPLVAAAMFALGVFIFYRGLRRYESTGS